jgi:hypothetical protein
MEYKLYTLVDITATGQYRPSTSSSDKARWQEQNFNTVLQTLGIRANITYRVGPELLEVKGRLVGFDTDDIIRVWRFDFYTERDHLFEKDNDPIGLLLDDFHLVPYIRGLHEAMEQQYAVFNCYDPGKNIAFFIK